MRLGWRLVLIGDSRQSPQTCDCPGKHASGQHRREGVVIGSGRKRPDDGCPPGGIMASNHISREIGPVAIVLEGKRESCTVDRDVTRIRTFEIDQHGAF